jgi:hypothetical protein
MARRQIASKIGSPVDPGSFNHRRSRKLRYRSDFAAPLILRLLLDYSEGCLKRADRTSFVGGVLEEGNLRRNTRRSRGVGTRGRTKSQMSSPSGKAKNTSIAASHGDPLRSLASVIAQTTPIQSRASGTTMARTKKTSDMISLCIGMIFASWLSAESSRLGTRYRDRSFASG